MGAPEGAYFSARVAQAARAFFCSAPSLLPQRQEPERFPFHTPLYRPFTPRPARQKKPIRVIGAVLQALNRVSDTHKPNTVLTLQAHRTTTIHANQTPAR